MHDIGRVCSKKPRRHLRLRAVPFFVIGLVALLDGVHSDARQSPPADDSRQAAIAAFQQSDLERAEHLSLAWLEAHPRDEEITRLLGMIRITAGMALEGRGQPRSEYLAVYRRAPEALLRAEKLASGGPQPDLHHAVGYILLTEGRYQEAAARLTRAIDETPRNFVLYRLRGSCRLELGLYLEAEADLRRAVELDERDWTSRMLHARALHLVGQGQAAREGLREYHRLIELGLPERAIPELDAVLAASQAPKAVRGDALHYRGMIAKQQGQNALARRCQAEALELNPSRADTLLNYGAALRALGETDEAHRVLERFQQVAEVEKDMKRLTDRLLLDPSEREARVGLIGLLILLQRWPEAREQLEELRRRHPGDAVIPDLERQIRPAG